MNRYYRRSTCCAVPRYQTPGCHSYHLCRFLRFSQVLLRPVRGLPSGKESLSLFWKGTVIHVQGNESIDCFMRALVCLICLTVIPVPQLKLVVLLVATKLSSFAQGFLNVPVPEYCIQKKSFWFKDCFEGVCHLRERVSFSAILLTRLGILDRLVWAR